MPTTGGSEKKTLPLMKTPETGACTDRLNPLGRMVPVLIVGVIILMAVVIAASASNRANYYLKAANGAVEVWQGRFAPMGMERLLILPGAQPPPAVKDVYSENDINVIAFNYYIDRADMLLEAPGMPDISGIKLYLKMALPYGISDEMRKAAFNRLNTIDMIIYLYKADVAASKGTLGDFKKALEYMEKAGALKLNEAQTDLVNMKTQSIKELMAALQEKNLEQPDRPVHVPAEPHPPQPDGESPAK
ncbi:MAG: hypothetical protein P1P89_07755 [Desulfobacterales bacterium]|nr:hypothetical protein [Desulfobacterales bacterium]